MIAVPMLFVGALATRTSAPPAVFVASSPAAQPRQTGYLSLRKDGSRNRMCALVAGEYKYAIGALSSVAAVS